MSILRSPGSDQTGVPKPNAGSPAFSGWTMLLVAGLAVFFSGPAQTYGVSAFVDPMLDELDWSRSLFSTVYSVGTLTSAGVLVVIGRQIDRFGNRLIMSISALVFGAALLILSVTGGVITLLIGFALLRTFGSSVLTLGARTLVPRWFHSRAGRAFSLIGLAAMLSQAAVPPFNEWMIGTFGWRSAWRINAAIVLAVLLPIVAIVTRNRPEDVSQFPDGLPPTSNDSAVGYITESGPTLREALRTSAFWALISTGVVPALVVTGLSFNQVAIMTDRGLPSSLAATTFAVDAAVALPTSLLTGWVVDRFPVRYALAAGQIFLAIAMTILLFVDSPVLALLYAAVRGIAGGLWSVAGDVAWPRYFGRRHLGSIRGFGFAVGATGAAIGPIPFGLAYDLFDGYTPAIAGLLALPVLAAIAVWRFKPDPVMRSQG